jgi:hypothetical protein
MGRSNDEILVELSTCGHNISMSTLKRRLREWNFTRKEVVEQGIIRNTIQDHITGFHATTGIRKMKQILLVDEGMFVKQETSRNMMAEIDPDGIVARKKRVLKRRLKFTNKE